MVDRVYTSGFTFSGSAHWAASLTAERVRRRGAGSFGSRSRAGGRDVDRGEIGQEMNRVRSEFHELIDKPRRTLCAAAERTSSSKTSRTWCSATWSSAP